MRARSISDTAQPLLSSAAARRSPSTPLLSPQLEDHQQASLQRAASNRLSRERFLRAQTAAYEERKKGVLASRDEMERDRGMQAQRAMQSSDGNPLWHPLLSASPLLNQPSLTLRCASLIAGCTHRADDCGPRTQASKAGRAAELIHGQQGPARLRPRRRA